MHTVVETLLFQRQWPLYWTEEERGAVKCQRAASAGHERDWRPVCQVADDAVARASTAIALDLVDQLRSHGVKNVYAELGSTWRYVMREPEQAAHLLGKLLKHFGEDNILWGTDSIWYGSPQDQILAFRAFDISREFQDQYGYPALTPAIKRKIFGLNGARVYGLKPEEMRKKLARDRVQKTKLDYLDNPDPAFVTYGPRTRREFLAFRALHGEMP